MSIKSAHSVETANGANKSADTAHDSSINHEQEAAGALALQHFFNEAYEKIDTDHSGSVSQKELQAAAKNSSLTFDERLAAGFIANHYGEFSGRKPADDLDRENVAQFATKIANYADYYIDEIVDHKVQEDLVAYSQASGITRTEYIPGAAQDASRLSNWLVAHFDELDLDKDGTVTYSEFDKLANSPLAKTPEFKTASEKWWEIGHVVASHESDGGITLLDAKTLGRAFNPDQHNDGYDYEQQEELSKWRDEKFGAITAMSALLAVPMTGLAFAGPPGWALDAMLGGVIAIAEGTAYLSYRKEANFVKSQTPQNYYEYRRREILSRDIFGELHRQSQHQ